MERVLTIPFEGKFRDIFTDVFGKEQPRRFDTIKQPPYFITTIDLSNIKSFQLRKFMHEIASLKRYMPGFRFYPQVCLFSVLIKNDHILILGLGPPFTFQCTYTDSHCPME
jgi:hypothetical protein